MSNFHPLADVDRGSKAQLQLGKNLNNIILGGGGGGVNVKFSVLCGLVYINRRYIYRPYIQIKEVNVDI